MKTFSIKKFLLINSLIAVLITAALTAVGNYYLNQDDLEQHIDQLLIETATSFQAMFIKENTPHTLQVMQNALKNQPNDVKEYLHKAKIFNDENFKTHLELQIVNDYNHILLKSQNAANKPLNLENTTTFKNVEADHQTWRLFSLYNPDTHIKIIVAAKTNIRDELAMNMFTNYLYTMLFMIPLSGFLISLIINLSLRTLNRIAKDVSHRDPNNLTPVVMDKIPTEIQPVIDEINQLLERLARGLEREQRFAADAAHELRTPLAALKTQAQVALQANDSLERANALHNVIMGVDRSTHIVQQLLTLSRLTPGASHLEDLVNINLPKLAADVIALLVPQALEKQIEIELRPEHESNIFIKGHLTALSILIRNLVDNAIRYTPENGSIKVSIYQTRDTVILSVADNGPGIPAELRSRVFERFYRIIGNKSTGSGLGMAIVQQIASLHHAKVKLQSPEKGTGLIVEVSFPTVID